MLKRVPAQVFLREVLVAGEELSGWFGAILQPVAKIEIGFVSSEIGAAARAELQQPAVAGEMRLDTR